MSAVNYHLDRALDHLASELIVARADEDYVLIGSTVMYLNGIRDDVGDIDVFLSPVGWDRLKARGWGVRVLREGDPPVLQAKIFGYTVHCWQQWNDRHGYGDLVEQAFAHIQIRKGWRVQSLHQLYDWKRWYVQHCGDHPRPKDVHDLIRLEQHWAKTPAPEHDGPGALVLIGVVLALLALGVVIGLVFGGHV